MQAVIDDTTAIYVTDDSPNNETRYRARFYLDPNSATISGGVVPIFFGYSGATVVVRLELYYSSGSYKIRARVLKDDSSWTYGSYVNISDASHYIELDWMAASSQGANDGRVTFWVDQTGCLHPGDLYGGNQQADLTGQDNDTRRVDYARLGTVNGVPPGTSGTYYFDAFESRRSTYIGQAGAFALPGNSARPG